MSPTESGKLDAGGYVVHGDRLASTRRLDGCCFEGLDGDHRWQVELVDGRALWTVDGDHGTDTYDAVEVRPGSFFVNIWTKSVSQGQALTLVLDTEAKSFVLVRSVCVPASAPPVVGQQFLTGALGSLGADPPYGCLPRETDALTGLALLSSYEKEMVYEHEYLDGALRWRCVRGELPGSHDTDPATFVQVTSDQFVIGFREKRFQCGSVFYMDFETMRCTGQFLAFDDGEFVNGGLGSRLSTTSMVPW